MKKLITLMLMFAVTLAGCAGRVANPVMIHQPGDGDKSCESLRAEMYQMESEIARLIPKSDKTGRNIACAATGVLFIVPLFFMDLKQGERIEVEAYRQRHNHLMLIAKEKGCKLTYSASSAESNAVPEKQEEAQAIGTDAEEQVATCVNCGESIGTLEKKYLYEGHTVCAQCNKKLTGKI